MRDSHKIPSTSNVAIQYVFYSWKCVVLTFWCAGLFRSFRSCESQYNVLTMEYSPLAQTSTAPPRRALDDSFVGNVHLPFIQQALCSYNIISSVPQSCCVGHSFRKRDASKEMCLKLDMRVQAEEIMFRK
jgi:hypothetical protein